jgi:hypothetical protein
MAGEARVAQPPRLGRHYSMKISGNELFVLALE